MAKDTQPPRQRTSSIPADLSDAITLLQSSLYALSEFTDPKVTDLAGRATYAADIVIDGLLNLAADIAEVTR